MLFHVDIGRQASEMILPACRGSQAKAASKIFQGGFELLKALFFVGHSKLCFSPLPAFFFCKSQKQYRAVLHCLAAAVNSQHQLYLAAIAELWWRNSSRSVAFCLSDL